MLQLCRGRRLANDHWGATLDRNRWRLRPSDPNWSWSAPGWWTARSYLCARRWPKQKWNNNDAINDSNLKFTTIRCSDNLDLLNDEEHSTPTTYYTAALTSEFLKIFSFANDNNISTFFFIFRIKVFLWENRWIKVVS